MTDERDEAAYGKWATNCGNSFTPYSAWLAARAESATEIKILHSVLGEKYIFMAKEKHPYEVSTFFGEEMSYWSRLDHEVKALRDENRRLKDVVECSRTLWYPSGGSKYFDSRQHDYWLKFYTKAIKESQDGL